jgi:hypothetical protein
VRNFFGTPFVPRQFSLRCIESEVARINIRRSSYNVSVYLSDFNKIRIQWHILAEIPNSIFKLKLPQKFCYFLLADKRMYAVAKFFFWWGGTYVTRYCGHFWPIVQPQMIDEGDWWNEDWQGKPKYSEKTCPSPTLSTTNPTWPDPGSNPGRRGGKGAVSN